MNTPLSELTKLSKRYYFFVPSVVPEDLRTEFTALSSADEGAPPILIEAMEGRLLRAASWATNCSPDTLREGIA